MKIFAAIAAFSMGACGAFPSLAQDQSRPIRLIVPFAVGGSTDIMARAVANGLSTVLSQPVIVENKTGATGAVAASLIHRAEPDGLTLLVTNVSASAIAPALAKVATDDPSRDVTAIGLVARSPMVLVANPSLNIVDTKGLIDAAKSAPGKIEYASAGVGSFGHLGTELFAQEAGIGLLHVPYQGQAPSIAALLSGEVKVSITSPSSTLFDLVSAGRLKLLGMSYLEPSALVPNVPPMARTLPKFEMVLWTGIVGPPGMSVAVVRRLSDALQTVLRDNALSRRFEASGSEAASGTPEEFRKLIASEAVRWRKVVDATAPKTMK